VHDAPGWWGMVVGLVVNATFYITLLFGYLYLWAVAPAWPPESFVDSGRVTGVIAAIASLACALAWHRAVRANAGGRSPEPALWLALAGGLLTLLALVWQIGHDVGAPTEHAYYAVTHFLLGYLALHALLAAAMAGFSILRWRHGFISPRRSLDLRVPRQWAGYTAAVTIISLALVHALPGLLGGSA
jgi:cytochrome c oxidase subunit I+III